MSKITPVRIKHRARFHGANEHRWYDLKPKQMYLEPEDFECHLPNKFEYFFHKFGLADDRRLLVAGPHLKKWAESNCKHKIRLVPIYSQPLDAYDQWAAEHFWILIEFQNMHEAVMYKLFMGDR